MNTKLLLDKKYAPFYLLIVGVIVFGGAFFYASGKHISNEEGKSEDGQELSVAGGGENVLDIKTEVTETPLESISPTPSPKPTKAVQTVTPSLTSSPSPTQTPTPTPENTQVPSSSTPSPSPTPGVSETPTPSPTPTP